MMKKVIPIILFTVSAILLSACGRKEELYEIPNLSQYKTDYVGDSSNVINIVSIRKDILMIAYRYSLKRSLMD